MNHELHKFSRIRIAIIRVNSGNSWLKNSFYYILKIPNQIVSCFLLFLRIIIYFIARVATQPVAIYILH